MMRMELLRGSAAAAVMLALASGTALAQDTEQTGDTQQTMPAQQPEVVALTEWNYDLIYADGWSAEQLLDEADVISQATGEDIGDVENIFVSGSGQIVSVIAEIGGFLDIGDAHVSVPWDQVEIRADDAGDEVDLVVPITEDNIDGYGLFGGDYGTLGFEEEYLAASTAKDSKQVVDEDVSTGPKVWRATDLIDDYVLLKDNARYGYVDDIIFSRAGQVSALIVDSDFAYGASRGPYAYPYYAYGRYPYHPYYTMPYGADEVVDLQPFDYEKMKAGAETGLTGQSVDQPATQPPATDTDTSD